MNKALGKIATVASLFFLRGGQAAFGMLIAIVMSRGMSEESLASAFFLLSIALSSGQVGVLGFDVILIKVLARSEPHSHKTRGHFFDLLIRFLIAWSSISALAVAFWLIFPKLVSSQVLGVSFGWLLLWLFLSAVQVFQSSVLLGFQRKKSSFLFVGALSSALTFVILFVELGLFQHLSVRSVAFGYICGLAISVAFCQWEIHRLMGFPTRLVGGGSSGSVSWSDLLSSSGVNFLAIGTMQVPFWVVALLGTEAQVVEYGLASRVALPLAIVLITVRSYVAPLLARSWHAGTISAASQKIRNIVVASFLANLVFSAFLIFSYGWIVGSVFQRPEVQTFWPLLWLLASQCVVAFFGQGQLFLRITDRHRLALKISIGTFLFQALVAPFAFWLYGSSGAAASVVLVNFVQGSISSLVVHHHHNIVIIALPSIWKGAEGDSK